MIHFFDGEDEEVVDDEPIETDEEVDPVDEDPV